MEDLFKILKIALGDGFIWFPMVLGVGLLYTHLKVIDVSIDGVIILSGIACAWIWNITNSYAASLIVTVITSILGYSIVSLLITKFKVNSILAGVLFSLVIHALSVILVGESIVLNGTRLFTNFMQFSVLPVIIFLVVAVISFLFYRSDIGISVRLVGNTPTANSRRSPHLLLWLGYSLTGICVGLGTFIYAHQQGVARAGGGFDFLVTSLCSFLVIDRLAGILLSFYSRSHKTFRTKRMTNFGYAFSTVIASPIFKALIGSIFFQIIVLLLISKIPNPAYWKMVFGLALLASVIKPDIKWLRFGRLTKTSESIKGLQLRCVTLGYNLGYKDKMVFKNLTLHFEPGINYVWGPNGSGKSTLLGFIHGLIPAQSGELYINGESKSFHPPYKRKTFFLNQDLFKSIAGGLTVYENLIASKQNGSKFKFSGKQNILNELKKELKISGLSSVGKDDEEVWTRRAGELSGGQAQRLAIYMALLSGSEVLLADEPSSGLDNDNLRRLVRILEGMASNGKIIIVATHDNRLFEMPGAHYIIKEGKLILSDGNINSSINDHQSIHSKAIEIL